MVMMIMIIITMIMIKIMMIMMMAIPRAVRPYIVSTLLLYDTRLNVHNSLPLLASIAYTSS